VVGGGLGGLAAAGLLSRAGLRVPLLEAAPYLGGKRRGLTLAGKRIDTGPELLTFLGIWEEYLRCWDGPNEGRAEEIAGLNLLRLPEIGTYHYQDDVCSLPFDCIASLRSRIGTTDEDQTRRWRLYGSYGPQLLILYGSERSPESLALHQHALRLFLIATDRYLEVQSHRERFWLI
jgi:protoporphyrinogen oxidase